MKIYFSPSSQTENTYAVGGTNEAAQCRAIAQAAVAAAKRCGLEAKTSLTGTMYDRVAESDAWGADLHLPIHTNAFDGKLAGTRMFCLDATGAGHRACEAILAAVAPITPGDSDGIRPEKFYEITAAHAPTAYLEVGFHDNPEEAAWIIGHTGDIGEAIVKGVCAWAGVAYAAPEPAEPAPKPTTEPAHYYRVRKTWDDAASQTGAFVELENAKAACPVGYAVFDWTGQAIYRPDRVYVVQKGDTLWAIARRYDTTADALAAYNRIANPSLIYAGQTIRIP